MQLRELDLHLRFGGTRTCRKDVENQLGSIDDAYADVVLDILALRGRQLFVEDDERGAARLSGLLELFGFAFTNVEFGTGLLDFLADPLDDACARGIRQLGQLIQMLIGEVGRNILGRRADKDGAFFGWLYVLKFGDAYLTPCNETLPLLVNGMVRCSGSRTNTAPCTR